MAYDKEKRVLTDKIGEFLFRKPKEGDNGQESKFLDTSTVIMNKSDYDVLTYYRILHEAYDCKSAGIIADILERLNIATVRSPESWNSRSEAVEILRQPLPKKETVLHGIADSLTGENNE